MNAEFSDLELEEGIRLILDAAHYILEKKAGVYFIRRSPDAPSGVKYHEVQLRYVTAENLMQRLAEFYGLSSESTEQSTFGVSFGQSGETVQMYPFSGPASLKIKDVTVIRAIDRNVLLMSGESSQVDEVLELITALDQKVPQVLIETYLIEYDEEALKESGIDLSIELIKELSNLTFSKPTAILSLPAVLEGVYRRTSEGETANGDVTSNGEDIYNTGDNDSAKIMARIHSLIDENSLTIMSKPYVVVSNGAQAFISAATEQYVIAALPGEQLATGSLQQVETRISFVILPTIVSDDRIHIQLNVEQSEFTTPRYNAALATNRNIARTSLVVADGETIVIGGVNSSREATGNRGIPVLRSIPVLKHIFGASKNSSSSRRVNFYITPHILPLKEEIVMEKIVE